MRILKQASAAQPIPFLLVLAADHITGATGLTPTVLLSKGVAAFAAPAGAVSEVGNGWYKVAGNATDTATLGPLLVHASATGTDPYDAEFEVVAFDPQDGQRLGVSALPAYNVGSPGGLLTSGTGPYQINPDGTGSVPIAFGTAIPSTPAPNTVGESLYVADAQRGRTGTAQAGTTTTITLDAGASSDTGAYVGDDLFLTGGTGGGLPGTGQRRTVIGYNPTTKVATVNRAWDTVPTSTTTFVTLPGQGTPFNASSDSAAAVVAYGLVATLPAAVWGDSATYAAGTKGAIVSALYTLLQTVSAEDAQTLADAAATLANGATAVQLAAVNTMLQAIVAGTSKVQLQAADPTAIRVALAIPAAAPGATGGLGVLAANGTLPVTVVGYAAGQDPVALLTGSASYLAGVAGAVWSATTRTLTAAMDSSGITTLLTRISSALTIANGKAAATVAAGDGVDSAAIVAKLPPSGSPIGDATAAEIQATTAAATSAAEAAGAIPTFNTAGGVLTVNGVQIVPIIIPKAPAVVIPPAG